MTEPHRIRFTITMATVAALLGGLVPRDARGADPVTRRVSVADDESQASGGDSKEPSVSADGRHVAFKSDATNLVPGDSNATADVFVRDRTLGTTERVSVDSSEAQSNGPSDNPRITPDGRFVVFDSLATNLVSGDGNGVSDVFIRDRTNGTTERASVNSAGVGGNGGSFTGEASSDGNLIAFASDATNLVAPDANAGAFDVFVRNRSAGTTTLASRNTAGDQGNAASGVIGPAISANGRYVAFESAATNLVSSDGNAKVDVFVRDLTDSKTERVSTTASGGEVDGDSAASQPPDITDDGRFVAFSSAATNLVSGDSNAKHDVFRKDRTTGAIIRASVKSDGTQGNEHSGFTFQGPPQVSPDGRFIGFPSFASNLVSGDANGFVDIFVHDGVTRETVRVNVSSEANGTSANPSVSAASEAAFESGATNLVSGDTNGFFDVFVRQFRKATGYFVLDNLGGIFTFGGAVFRGSVPGLRAAGTPVGSAAIVDLEVTPSGKGYYVLDEAGGIFTFGDAAFFGSVPGLRASGVPIGPARILDMAVTPSGLGYLILDEAGGIFTFGDAAFFGSIPGLRDAGVSIGPAQGVDLAMMPSGRGYLILDNLGGIFTFGDAVFFGSLPGLRAAGVSTGNAPAIRLAPTPTGRGYLVLDDVGGMFTFGDATFFGSLPGLRNAGVPIGPSQGVDLAITPSGNGYLVLDNVGGIFTFGDGEFFGSVPALRDAGVSIGPNSSIRVDLVSSMVGG